MKDSTFYIVAGVFVFGIFLRSFFALGLSVITWLVLLAFALVLVGKIKNFSISMFCGLLIFFFSLGVLRMEVASWYEVDDYLESHLNNQIELEGVVVREPEARARSVHLYIETDHGLILAITDPGSQWNYGDQVRLSGTLKYPESFETDLGRTFNYRGYLLAKGVTYMISYAEVELLGQNQGNFIVGHLLQFKHSFMKNVESILPEPQAGLGEGLLLGVKRALGEDLEESFRRTGIIHIVVLSGYNVMLVVYFILYFLRFLGRRASAWLGLAAIAAFAVLVGLGSTVVRASLMAGLLLIMSLTGRVYFVIRGLLLAGIVMLLWNPYALAFDVGFQLSFLATLGLILISPYLERRLQVVPNGLHIREFLVATLSTQLFVLPLLLYQIGEFSAVAVLVNVLVLPMVPIAMLLTFITGVLAYFSVTIATPVAYLAFGSLKYIIDISKWFGDFSFAAFDVPPFSFWLVPVAYALLAWLIWFLQKEPDELKGWTIVEE